MSSLLPAPLEACKVGTSSVCHVCVCVMCTEQQCVCVCDCGGGVDHAEAIQLQTVKPCKMLQIASTYVIHGFPCLGQRSLAAAEGERLICEVHVWQATC